MKHLLHAAIASLLLLASTAKSAPLVNSSDLTCAPLAGIGWIHVAILYQVGK